MIEVRRSISCGPYGTVSDHNHDLEHGIVADVQAHKRIGTDVDYGQPINALGVNDETVVGPRSAIGINGRQGDGVALSYSGALKIKEFRSGPPANTSTPERRSVDRTRTPFRVAKPTIGIDRPRSLALKVIV